MISRAVVLSLSLLVPGFGCDGGICLFSATDIQGMRNFNNTVFELFMIMGLAAEGGRPLSAGNGKTVLLYWKQMKPRYLDTPPVHNIVASEWKAGLDSLDGILGDIVMNKEDYWRSRERITGILLGLYEKMGVPPYFYYTLQFELNLFLARRHLAEEKKEPFLYDLTVLRKTADRLSESYMMFVRGPSERAVENTARKDNLFSGVPQPVYDFNIYADSVKSDSLMGELKAYAGALLHYTEQDLKGGTVKQTYLAEERKYKILGRSIWKSFADQPSYPLSVFNTSFRYEAFSSFKLE